MSIFDNASSITIGEKEVASIKIGENVIYEGESYDPDLICLINFTGTSFTPLPSANGFQGKNIVIDWGDGNTEQPYDDAGGYNPFPSHTYSENGTYTISITAETKYNFGNKSFSGIEGITSIQIFPYKQSDITVGKECFKDCTDLRSIILPSLVYSFGMSTFENCTSLDSITLPPALTMIGMNCFKGCSSLENISIPSTITKMGKKVFEGCSSLESICFNSSTPPTVTDEDLGIPNGVTIYVPNGSLNNYTNATGFPSASDVTYVEY